MYTIKNDSGGAFWLVRDNNKNEIRKVYDSDIEAIEIQKTNWIATSFLILIGALALTYLILASIFSGDGSLGGGGSF